MARQPARVEILSTKRLLDGFFKIDQFELTHELFNGEMSPTLSRLVFERGDAVAALLFDPDRRKMILVNQFRLPTRDKGRGKGWILETMAGMIRPEESPESCLLRELREETGYQVKEFTQVATFYSSPGGSTERIFLYFAEVRLSDKVAPGGGVPMDGKDIEDIQLVELDAEEFYRRLQAHEFEDPKIIIAGQWFQGQFGRLKTELDKNVSRTIRYRLKGAPDRIIGIKTGDILATRDVDVWVNSENIYMMMDRYFGASISAAIRRGGARKNRNNTIAEDTIGNALAEALHGRGFVKLGMVIPTESGDLATTNKVQQIYHVATAEGAQGGGLQTTIKTIEECAERVLSEIHKKWKYKSALLPLLGTGQGGLGVHDVASKLIEHGVAFLKGYPDSRLKEIYFLAYLNAEEAILKSFLDTNKDFERMADA